MNSYQNELLLEKFRCSHGESRVFIFRSHSFRIIAYKKNRQNFADKIRYRVYKIAPRSMLPFHLSPTSTAFIFNAAVSTYLFELRIFFFLFYFPPLCLSIYWKIRDTKRKYSKNSGFPRRGNRHQPCVKCKGKKWGGGRDKGGKAK